MTVSFEKQNVLMSEDCKIWRNWKKKTKVLNQLYTGLDKDSFISNHVTCTNSNITSYR